MKKCFKCNNDIPKKATIDGKQRNLQNRKFCLVCSPFGIHNTSSITPRDPSKTNTRKQYANWTEEQKINHRANCSKRGNNIKLDLVNLSGGKCLKCGYNKCVQALHFHHVDPSQKSFCLNSRNVRINQEAVLEEWKKCILLCSICHTELEFKIWNISELNL